MLYYGKISAACRAFLYAPIDFCRLRQKPLEAGSRGKSGNGNLSGKAEAVEGGTRDTFIHFSSLNSMKLVLKIFRWTTDMRSKECKFQVR